MQWDKNVIDIFDEVGSSRKLTKFSIKQRIAAVVFSEEVQKTRVQKNCKSKTIHSLYA